MWGVRGAQMTPVLFSGVFWPEQLAGWIDDLQCRRDSGDNWFGRKTQQFPVSRVIFEVSPQSCWMHESGAQRKGPWESSACGCVLKPETRGDDLCLGAKEEERRKVVWGQAWGTPTDDQEPAKKTEKCRRVKF